MYLLVKKNEPFVNKQIIKSFKRLGKKKRDGHPTSTLIARGSGGWLHQHTRRGGDPPSTLVAVGSVGQFHPSFSFIFGLNTLLMLVV